MTTDLRIGTRIGGYSVESMLGRGGMSVVYLAEDAKLGRQVALKIMSEELAENDAFRTRFIREAQMAAKLEHPSIVPVYDAGEADGVLYLAMRVIRGTDLRRVITGEGPMDPERALGILRQVASALDAAHRAGLVHRDVKPANVLISHEGDEEHAYLTDFGLTKSVSSRSGLTQTGQFMGTIDYVAPEQIRGNDVDGRTDQYSLGCVAYECLTGVTPFPKDQDVAILFAHLEDDRPSVASHRPDLPRGIDAVAARAMAREPVERYPTCLAFVQDARKALELGRDSVGPSTVPAATPTVFAVAPAPVVEPHPSFPPASPSFPPVDTGPSVPPVEAEPSVPPIEAEPAVISLAAAEAVSAAEPATAPVGSPSGPGSTPPLPVAPEPARVRPDAPPASGGRRRGLLVAAVVVALAIVGTVGALALSGGGKDAALDLTASPSEAPSPAESPSPSPAESPSPSPTTVLEVAPPVRPPINPRTTSVTATAVTLTWAPAPNGGEVVQFLILRDGEQIGKTTQTTFTDDQVTPSSTFVYQVVAVGADGPDAPSKEITVSTPSATTSGGGGGSPPAECSLLDKLAGKC